MQRINAKDDAVEGGENGERPPSSQPIAPAMAGQAPPQPAGKSIAYFTEGRGNAGQDGEERPNAVWPSGARRLRGKSEKPLTPLELFRRGIEITQEIRGRIEESRAYYFGRSSRAPGQSLSEVFDPTRGPILKYFIETIRTINRTRFIERFCRTATFREFRQSSDATLEELRLLAIQLATCLGVPDKTDRRRSVGQALKTSIYFFRVANGRFFRQLPWSGSLVHLLLKNRNNEGMGIYVADRLLNDIAKAFEVRERQLRGESAAVEHEFFITQIERIERKIESEHERTRQRIEETNGLVQKILSTVASVISAVASAAKQITKSINTRNIDGLDITGPRTPECRDQVFAVVIFLANPKHPQSIHHACDRTFRFVENGYSSAHALFLWCQRNENRLLALVESYRLNHDIT